ncbi:MAG: hypothetical protein IH796_02295 [Deltaproteobacteria bacterium]|nr:hypothetical protein [Deltaproteobacteria bacterium]
MYPYLTHDPVWFSFLVHPRDMADLYRCRESAFLLDRSQSEEDFLQQLAHHPPTVIGEVTFSGSAVRGEIIAVGFLPKDMFSTLASRKIIEALELARQRGAKTVGLGGLTSSATIGGKSLLPYADGISLTNGNAYTASTVANQVNEAAQILGLRRPIKVGILGCTGSVGIPATRLLAEAEFELILVGRNEIRVQNLFGDLHGSILAGDPSTLRKADIVVLLTSGGEAGLRESDISDSTIVLDFAQPANLSGEFHKAVQGRNITVMEGGLVTIPGYRNTVDWGLKYPESTFACLAETVLFSREGLRNHSVGRPSLEFVRRIERVAKRHGVSPLPITRQEVNDSATVHEGI